jgi:hypothetical protein
MQTYSENSAGGESSPATDDPDTDGSPGSSSAEMPAEEAGIQSDDRPSPLSDQPDDCGSVPHPPATPVASRPNDAQEDETRPIIPEMDQDKAPDESGTNVAELGRKRALSSATESSPPKGGTSKAGDGGEGEERSQPQRKSRRVAVEFTPTAPQTRSVGAAKGALKKK